MLCGLVDVMRSHTVRFPHTFLCAFTFTQDRDSRRQILRPGNPVYALQSSGLVTQTSVMGKVHRC